MLRTLCACTACGHEEDRLEITARVQARLREAYEVADHSKPQEMAKRQASIVGEFAWWEIEGRRLDQGAANGLTEIGAGVGDKKSHACSRKCLASVAGRLVVRFADPSPEGITPPYQIDVRPLL